MTNDTKTPRKPRRTLRAEYHDARREVWESRLAYNLAQRRLRGANKEANALEQRLFGNPTKGK